MSPDTFYTGTDWEQSSGPITSRQVHLTDIWPVGLASEIGGGDKDVLEDGLHPAVAVGPKANRPKNPTGVVVTFEDDGDLVILNLADKFISRQYVANILTYSGTAASWDGSLALGDPVYVDDSADLSAGCTLSRSPLNSAGSANPLFGYIWYCQDDYADFHVGGPNETAGLPVVVADDETVETLLCVMQVNDFGMGS